MNTLTTYPNVAHPDDIYELLIQLHDGLSEAQSRLVNAKLILLLVNQVGDERIIREAIAAAAASLSATGRAEGH